MSLDLTQFHGAFFEESFEALDSMEAALLKLDVGAPDPELINTIFRVAHSIKGGGATFGFGDITSFTHSLETLLDELRAQRVAVTAAISDLLLKSVDVMRDMLRAVQGKAAVDAQRVADLQLELEVAIMRKDGSTAGALDAGRAPHTHRWRIDFRPFAQFFSRGNDPLRMLRELGTLGTLEVRADIGALPTFTELDPQACHTAWLIELTGTADAEAIREVFDWATGDCELTVQRDDDAPMALLDQRGEAASGPPARAAAAPAAKSDTPNISGIGDTASIRVSVEKIDELMNTVGELVITQAMLSQLGQALEGPAASQLRSGLDQLERHMRELQDSVMRVRMLPISFVFSRFPRTVRDLAHRLGKQIDLRVSGEHTELDKTVLEKIGDPLVHLVRNSIDHGIEKREARIAAGKPAEGVIQLDAWHRGGNIVVEVSDDGGGLDHERILAKARERGLVGADTVLSEAEVYDLIFVPGFSTAERTTDVSGRGVGMDVVRRNIKELNGRIQVQSERGRGARFTITLPLTLAIVDGQSVAVGHETYIVPLTSIIESLQLKPQQTNRLSGRGEVFQFRGSYLPVIRLHQIFGIEPRVRELADGLVVVVEEAGRRVGLFVDDLLGQQQVVIKSLATNYGSVEGVSGATILGDGSVALILDLPGLIRVTSLRQAA